MARPRPSLLGLVGSALMAASLFLPQATGSDVIWPTAFVENAGWPELYLVLALVALSGLLSWARPTWAWGTSVVWLVALAWYFWRLGVSFPWGDSWFGLEIYLSPWSWFAAFGGGGCVLVASLREVLRAPPQTDVAAFE